MEYKPSDTHTEMDAQRALETRLPAMLSRLADGMPASVGLADRVERQLATTANAGAPQQPTRWGGVFGAPVWRQRAISAVGLVVVLALIAGFAVVLRAHQISGRPAQQGGGCASTAINVDRGCILDNAKVSITVTNTYVDVSRTSVQLRYTFTHASIPYGTPTKYGKMINYLPLESLEYAPGLTLAPSVGEETSGKVQGSFQEILVFSALPSNLLSRSRVFTLMISKMTVQDNAGHIAHIPGSWSVSVHLTPQPSTTITFHVAPVTRNGVTIRPIALRVAPDVQAFDGIRGGQVLVLAVSGLPATMDIDDVILIATQVQIPGTFGYVSAPNGGNSGAILTFEDQQPAFVNAEGYSFSPQDTGSTPVGPSGAVTLDIAFTGPPLPTLTGNQPLVIDQIGYSYTGSPSQPITGPWDFQLPLS